MTQLRTLCCILTLALVLVLLLPVASALAAGDDKTTTITSTDTNVKVQLLLGGKDAKGRTLPPVDVPPSADGHTFKIEPQLFGSTPLPDGLYPFDCGDGKIIFAMPGANIDDVCPEEHRRPLAYVPTGSTGQISTSPDGITHMLTITGRGTAAVTVPPTLAPSPNSLYWGQVGAGLGVGAGNSLNDCDPFNQVFLTSRCTATNRALTFNVGGQLGVTPFFAFSGEYFHIGTFDRKATAPTFLEQSSGETQFGSFMGRGIIPLGPVSLFGEGGVAVWRTNLTEHQTLGSSTTPITTKLTVNGVSPAGGIGMDFKLSKHFGLQAEYVYFEQQKSVDSHYHVGVAGFHWNW